MTSISRRVGDKQAVSTRKMVGARMGGKYPNERGSIARGRGRHQTREHSCDVQKLANEIGRRKGHVLISLTGRNGHCDISPYDSRDFLSCEISLRNAMLASTGREYCKGLEWPLKHPKTYMRSTNICQCGVSV